MKSMKIRLVFSLSLLLMGLLVALASLIFQGYFPHKTAFAKENLIRLHVLPNSNLPKDQDLKLVVRDAVLLEAAQLLAGVDCKDKASTVLQQNIGKIEAAAQRSVCAQGYDYPVFVQVGNFPFPERAYGHLILPEGFYDAVQVRIGRGSGENWWCVLFPPLCLDDLNPSVARLTPETAEKGTIQRRIAFRWKLWEQINQTQYAQTIQRWWRASAANYPQLAK